MSATLFWFCYFGFGFLVTNLVVFVFPKPFSNFEYDPYDGGYVRQFEPIAAVLFWVAWPLCLVGMVFIGIFLLVGGLLRIVWEQGYK